MNHLVYECTFGPGNEPRCHVVHDGEEGHTRIWVDGVADPIVTRGGDGITISFGVINPDGCIAQLRITREPKSNITEKGQ